MSSVDAQSAVLPDSVDPDTCRICRGEGSKEEPLFYPCKCSGSIKYVHQDCLMEWLSHSQKKYCELCKTPFRFTKLYHPHMPRSLPTGVFFRRAAMHFLSQIALYFRAVLVFSVWLVFLPWAMRSSWRFLFWMADSGWARTFEIESTWSSSLPPATVANSSAWTLPTFRSSRSNNTDTTAAPLFYRIFKSLVIGATVSSERELYIAMNTNSTSNNTAHQLIRQKYSSVLSDVRFFRELTSSAAFNRSVMDILEGLMITLCVVIAFILVFLIREWVIQQQPMLGMDADANNGMPPAFDALQRINNELDHVDLDWESDDSGPQLEDDLDDTSSDDEIPVPTPPSQPSDGSEAPNTSDAGGLPSLDDIQDPEPTGVFSQEQETNESDAALVPAAVPAPEWPGTQRMIWRPDSPDSPLHQNPYIHADDSAVSAKGKEPAHAGPEDEHPSSDTAPVASQNVPHESLSESEALPTAIGSEPQVQAEEEPIAAMEDAPLHVVNATEPQTTDLGVDDLDQGPIFGPALPTPDELNQQNARLEAERGRLGAWLHWFWGDITPPPDTDDESDRNDEHVVRDLADEEPFVPFADAQPVLPAQNLPPPVGNDAIMDALEDEANDADAADDAEDLEGILELIGMQGPLIGLFQNAIFSALLITATIMGIVQAPYMLGKLELFFLGNPMLIWFVPLQFVSSVADFLGDFLLFNGGLISYYASKLLLFLRDGSQEPLKGVALRAGDRLLGSVKSFGVAVVDSSATLEMSLSSHATLVNFKDWFFWVFRFIASQLRSLNRLSISDIQMTETINLLTTTPVWLWNAAKQYLQTILTGLESIFKTGTISFSLGEPIPIADKTLAYWSAKDRAITILVGYAVVALAAAFYVAYLAPITTSTKSKRFELALVEVIKQAGGVCKVIFIISIEMIAFPLFCGFLLDLALLPLFENSSISSRLSFTYNSPWISGFVHWFVGTCYMFHFALFVSMCRKIMRNGVLYFIRDPDDPTFHPVRDVLERPVTVQLRKIAFSAVVYGTLIVVCLGGVVWSLGAGSSNVLPIHWSSSESEREFPLDILFFNFLTPFVVRYTKPTDGLHAMYQWWFRRCARALRLSNFLFNERHEDEEGYYPDLTWLEWIRGTDRKVTPQPLDEETSDEAVEASSVTVETGSDVVEPSKEAVEPSNEAVEASTGRPSSASSVAADLTDSTSDWIPDGRYARVPASDQIRIPKGAPVFLEVDKDNNRLDGEADEGLHNKNSPLVTLVYIPPWFKTRIGIFVLAIWIFAAVTGISITILPLLLGRFLFSIWMPAPTKPNDIYAFSLGIYFMGGIIYTAIHLPKITSFARSTLARASIHLSTLYIILRFSARVLSTLYVYTTIAIGLPILLAILLELYILAPLHSTLVPTASPHFINLIQDWTLGLLYLRIVSHFILAAPPNSAPHRLLVALMRNGILAPDARLATRAIILPAILAFSLLGALPLVPAASLALMMKTTGGWDLDEEQKKVLRMAYPAALAGALNLWLVYVLGRAVGRWRGRIRDEVYLIGERLHNFGERRGVVVDKERDKEQKVVPAEAESSGSQAIQETHAVQAGEATLAAKDEVKQVVL
ncbi:hypothetical protein BT63DRAFT_421734 [Microthyrium microscopicum]|uniref:RING-type E3 ubiquitin transferase n=1 Tax=Microthyrium microscopicum TaxID=703497 RepID=A0A6A6UQ96_9PEZI|nr:hypothetical protein BT63DRAFT_421734 [Microthyrium microscopicum]